MILPNNIEASFPLDICDECSNCTPEIESVYRITDYSGEYTHYKLHCTSEKGCAYAYERKEQKNE